MKKKFVIFITIPLLLAASVLLAEPPGRNFLWRLESPGGRRAYIMGSMHAAYAGLYPLNEPFMAAFADSDLLLVEINTNNLPPGQMERFIARHGYTADQRPLPERLSARTREVLALSGYYQSQMARMTPWLAALVIQVEAMRRHGFSPEYGIDKYFIEEAGKRKIRILELETLDEQMGMLANMSDKEADLFLLSSLLEMGDLPKIMQAFFDSWQNGDPDAFSEAFFEEYYKYPELRPVLDIIIFSRNYAMAAKIHGLAAKESGVCFIVIGAGHLVGDRSVLAGLIQRGWKAWQL